MVLRNYLKFIQLCLLLNLILYTVSCAAPTGLVRTQFKQWETIKFNLTGLTCELPQQSFAERNGYYIKESASPRAVAGLGYKKIRIRMHPVWHGSFTSEPFYLIEIFIIRLASSNYEKYEQGKHRIRSYDQFRANYGIFHSDIKEYELDVPGFEGRDTDNLVVIRKDYRAPDGDYILCGASLYATPGYYPPPTNADIKATMRILNSIEFLQ